MGFSGTPNNEDPIMVSFPNYSHTTPIRIPKDMGIVWESYHKGVPLLGVPGITLGISMASKKVWMFRNGVWRFSMEFCFDPI